MTYASYSWFHASPHTYASVFTLGGEPIPTSETLFGMLEIGLGTVTHCTGLMDWWPH